MWRLKKPRIVWACQPVVAMIVCKLEPEGLFEQGENLIRFRLARLLSWLVGSFRGCFSWRSDPVCFDMFPDSSHGGFAVRELLYWL
jgi:hypothetical protein